MADLETLRGQIIEELWLPIIREAGREFYGRRRKKRMKLFTLTDGVIFKELIRLEEEDLIQRGDAVLWVSNMIKAVRAETESRGVVLSGSICDEEVLGTSCHLNSFSPYDILNLDFSSQENILINARIERELEKTEHFINLQNQRHCKEFVVLLTTVINVETLNRDRVKNNSDAICENGWNGLILDRFPQAISDNNQKSNFIEHILQSLSQKYKYKLLKIANTIKIIDSSQQLCSIGGIFGR